MESIISENSIIAAVKNQVSCDLLKEVVVLDLDSGVYYGLSEVGALIWSRIQQPMVFSDIRQAILSEYDVEPSRCERDLQSLLQELAKAKLIDVQAGAAS